MSWVAVVPSKQGAEQKSRLATMLSPDQRQALSARLLDGVLQALAQCSDISRIVILAPADPARASTEWARDAGRGLNVELAALRQSHAQQNLIVLHADLPLLAPGDVTLMLRAAERCGVAIAPDRMRTGTNALAVLAGRTPHYAFGEESFSKHMAAMRDACVVDAIGFSYDVDTPEDLREAMRLGFALDV